MSDELRIWVIGLGTVGQWLIRTIHERQESLSTRYDFAPKVVGVANARDGFIYDSRGLDVSTLLALTTAGRAITEHPEVSRWASSLEGLKATEADVLVEVTSSSMVDGEPGLAHMREALGREIPVVTSNKWPVALHGVELAASARSRGVAFRAESTVMSGTPVLSPLVDGLAGAVPLRLRGVLNATANFMLTAMENGRSYAEALADAQDLGLAERDPSADVEGWDSMAKTMILAGLVFGEQLRPEGVSRRGISHLDRREIEAAAAANSRIRLVSTLESSRGTLTARVEPMRVAVGDTLAMIEGVTNAVVCHVEPVGEVTITGPGAGPGLAGQGVLSDLIAIARRRTAPGSHL